MNSIDRRTVLRGIGATIALPILELMTPMAAFAQSAQSSPTRMAFLFVPNGVRIEHWTPATEGKLGALPPILEPLSAFKNDLSILTGLAQKNAFALGDGPGDHARSSAVWLTGVHPRKTAGSDIQAGISADQLAAKAIGAKTKFPSLELGCERGGLAGDCDSGYSCAYSNAISWAGPQTPMAKETNPRLVFERLFGSGKADEDAQARYKRQKFNLSVLDFVLGEAAALERQLGSRDLQKLDEYLTAVREIEKRLVAYEKQDLKTVAEALRPTSAPKDLGEHIRLMGDMMILAFQTDLTRIATFMFANEGSNRPYRMIGISDGHHELSHHGRDPKKLEQKGQIDRYHAEQLAYILKRMKETREGESNLLDNTMLVYGGGISDGDRHNHDDLPILFAGKARGSFKPGQHHVLKGGTPMNNLLVSMLDRMGIPGEKLGDATGPLDGLF